MTARPGQWTTVPWYRRLSMRLAIAAVLGSAATDVVFIDLFPIFGDAQPETPFEKAQWTLAYASIQASIILFVSYFIASRRLSRIAHEAAEPSADPAELPGPFHDQGSDEIAVLAKSLNVLRVRVQEGVAQIEQRDHRRREWVRQASHDLRTPLTALVSSLARMQDLIDGGRIDREEVHALLGAAREDATRMRAISEDLLESTRLEDAVRPLVLEPVPVGELVRRTRLGLEPLLHGRGLTIHQEIADDVPELQADGRLLTRALENLLANSIRHAESRIEVRVSMEGPLVRFQVTDDGPGFPTLEGETPFQAVRRGRGINATSGLGLLVTSRVAELHGGDVGALNREPRGSTVWFDIPVSQDGRSGG